MKVMFYNLKIKTIIACLLSMCLAMSVQAVTILWQVAIDENAKIHHESESVSLHQFFSDNIEQAAFRIRNVEENKFYDFQFIDSYYDEDIGAIVIDHTMDGEWGLEIATYDANGNYEGLIEAQQMVLKYEDEDDPDYLSHVIVELGIFDDEYNFNYIGESSLYTLSEATQGHTYNQGTLLPPVTDWVVTDFYTDYPVPEPSIAILTILGVCTMLLGRKNGQ